MNALAQLHYRLLAWHKISPQRSANPLIRGFEFPVHGELIILSKNGGFLALFPRGPCA